MKKSKRPRNWTVNHPLMQKGGVHEKTKKALRKGEKQKLRKELLAFKQKVKLTFELFGDKVVKAVSDLTSLDALA